MVLCTVCIWKHKAELYGRCLLNMEALGERIWEMALSFDQTWWRLPTQLNNEVASSPGPAQKSGKGPGVTCKNSRMCRVSSLRLE